MGMHFEKISGELLCTHCSKPLRGDCVVDYHWEDDFVEDILIVHKACAEPYKMKQKGLPFECPKCNKAGKVPAHMDETGHITWPGTKPCDLCNGRGWLAKEPKPITKVVGWEKG